MVIVLYSDSNYEYQAVACINSIKKRLNLELQVLYVTIGFDYQPTHEFVKTVRLELNPQYPTFHFYKPEVCLLGMSLYPDENHFIYTDTDVIFSKNFNPDKMKHHESYPVSSFGPHEFPFMWEIVNEEMTLYNEGPLMEYLGVTDRTQRYVLNCFFTYNRSCMDFMEEWMSFCLNKYLLDRRKIYYPFPDETPFNVLLWKRKATLNLGFAFINTDSVDTIKSIEGGFNDDSYHGKEVDVYGKVWEYDLDINNIMVYHGIKDKVSMELISSYLETI